MSGKNVDKMAFQNQIQDNLFQVNVNETNITVKKMYPLTLKN